MPYVKLLFFIVTIGFTLSLQSDKLKIKDEKPIAVYTITPDDYPPPPKVQDNAILDGECANALIIAIQYSTRTTNTKIDEILHNLINLYVIEVRNFSTVCAFNFFTKRDKESVETFKGFAEDYRIQIRKRDLVVECFTKGPFPQWWDGRPCTNENLRNVSPPRKH